MSLTVQLAAACALTLALFGYAALPSARRPAHRRRGHRVQLLIVAVVATTVIFHTQPGATQ